MKNYVILYEKIIINYEKSKKCKKKEAYKCL